METRRRNVRHGRIGPLMGVVVLVVVVLPSACGDDEQPTETTVGLANPASVFCEERGGRVEIVDEAGGQRGDCIFPDGTRIDEWEYYRAHASPTTTAP